MRIRSVKPDFWRDPVTGEMPPEVALFYVGLWCIADDEGRFEWDPRLIRADLDPYDTKFPGRIDAHLAVLVAARRVTAYEVDGRRFGLIPTFMKHQSPKKPSTRCPPPPEPSAPVGNRFRTGSEPVGNGSGTGAEPVPPGCGGGVEAEAEGKRRRTASPSAPPPTPANEGADHHALVARLVSVFEEVRGVPYGFQGGKDGKAVAELLRLAGGDADEVVRRWRRALAFGTKWPGTASIAALPSRWNELTSPSNGAAHPVSKFTGHDGRIDFATGLPLEDA